MMWFQYLWFDWHFANPLRGLGRARSTVRSNLLVEKPRRTTQPPSTQSVASQEYSTDVELKLNNLVGEAVAQGLAHFGGRNVVESLIYILELEHSVNLRNVANELDALRSGLEKMFGDAAYVVEGKVRNNLAKSLGLDPEGRTLEQLVEAAKKSIELGREKVQ